MNSWWTEWLDIKCSIDHHPLLSAVCYKTLFSTLAISSQMLSFKASLVLGLFLDMSSLAIKGAAVQWSNDACCSAPSVDGAASYLCTVPAWTGTASAARSFCFQSFVQELQAKTSQVFCMNHIVYKDYSIQYCWFACCCSMGKNCHIMGIT
jgi:hypothetical protein